MGKKGKGFLPLISTAPKDHHSLLQLYLDGPRDKIFYIFSEERPNSKKIKIKRLDKRIDFLQNKSLQQVKNAQKNAFIQALKKNSKDINELGIFVEIKDHITLIEWPELIEKKPENRIEMLFVYVEDNLDKRNLKIQSGLKVD